MKKINLKSLFSVFNACKHEDLEFISIVSRMESNYEPLQQRCYMKCKKCKKIVLRYHRFDDVVTGILGGMNKGMVHVLLRYADDQQVSAKKLIDNIRSGKWFFQTKNLENSISYYMDMYRKQKEALNANSEKRIPTAEQLKFDNFSIKHDELLQGNDVTFGMADGRLFIQILSFAYGYEKARYRWSWEFDHEKGKMVIGKRKERRTSK